MLTHAARRGLPVHRLFPAARRRGRHRTAVAPRSRHGARRRAAQTVTRRRRRPMTALLEVDGLTKSFGGLAAVNGSLRRLAGRDARPDRAERLGQDDDAQPDRRQPRAGWRQDPPARRRRDPPVQPPAGAARINRTFQLVRMLPSMTGRTSRRCAVRCGAASMAEASRKTACAARLFRDRRQGGTDRLATHLYRAEAGRTRARAGDRSARSAARRMALRS